ncbi:hypothetical protein SAMN05421810_103750 [Amycolatopsis arida]|uniref:Uncharacterized protein n=1 Tax=Amycolatopsis arida TaxID=587909 RepID=A0A1I5U2H1_9PSEU|nr:hypothetical protein [Amycolatopsis arida]TDX95875.1 hypothetical protein CLV69_1037 [Amycolatopsis arida]SFP88776.1 hypothetical protein SAMN05421810_103750 [Amycolatopsis arida]
MAAGQLDVRRPSGRWTYRDLNVGFAWLRLIGVSLVVIDHSVPLVRPERLTILPEG